MPGCTVCGDNPHPGNCPICSRVATVGHVVPVAGLPGLPPMPTAEQLESRLASAVARDKAYADAKAVAARLRRHGEKERNGYPDGYPADEVEILLSYFLDHVPPRG